MKRHLVVLVVGFLLGLVIFSPKQFATELDQSTVKSRSKTASSRENHNFTEFEEVLFSEGEKVELMLDRANSLSALLGLVETMSLAKGDKWQSDDAVVGKLAKLYPVESLRYYAARPTNADMNAVMWMEILKKWAMNDLSACLQYLDRDSEMDLEDFSGHWIELARNYGTSEPDVFLAAFSQLDNLKQNAIMSSTYDLDLRKLILPAIKDANVREVTETKLLHDQALKDQEEVSSPQKQLTVEEDQEVRIKALVEDISKRKLEPVEFKEILLKETSLDSQLALMRDYYAPREENEESPEMWLTRIAATFDEIDVIPPELNQILGPSHGKYLEALTNWLPRQSPRVQRAWADDVIQSKSLSGAIKWVDQLGTPILRADLRNDLLETWTRSDSAAEAAQYLTENASAEEQSSHLPEAVYRWALFDYNAAKAWIDTQADSPAKAAALKKLEE